MTTIESRIKELNSKKISRVKDGFNTQITEDAIRQILSQNEMFNSKDIQKEFKSSHKIVLSDSSITKKLKDMGYSYSAPTPWLKFSKAQMEVREKWAKDSSVVNWNNAIYIDEAAFYGGDFTHKKYVSASEEYSVKRARSNFKCKVFYSIYITGILTFEFFEGGFNSDKFLDILKRNLKFIKQAWG